MRKLISVLIIIAAVAVFGVACGGGGKPPHIQEIIPDIREPIVGQTITLHVIVDDSDTDIFDLDFSGEVLKGDGFLTKDAKVVNRLHYQANSPGEHTLQVIVTDPQENSDERTFSIIFHRGREGRR